MPCLDASFLIDLQRAPRKYRRVLERLAEEGRLFLPTVAAIEYLWGIRSPRASLPDLDASYELTPFDEETLRIAVEIAEEHRPNVGAADIQIAATARRFGTYVVTANPKDFRALGVPVWDYRAEGEPPPRQ